MALLCCRVPPALPQRGCGMAPPPVWLWSWALPCIPLGKAGRSRNCKRLILILAVHLYLIKKVISNWAY